MGSGSGVTQRVSIQRGKLVTYYEPHDLPGALIRVEFQVYDEKGAPLTQGDYDGVGVIVEIPGNRDRHEVILGDPHRKATLTVYTADKRPTRESDDYDRGYRRGFVARRSVSGTVADRWSAAELDGWQVGFAAGKRARAAGRGDRGRDLDGIFGRSAAAVATLGASEARFAFLRLDPRQQQELQRLVVAFVPGGRVFRRFGGR